LSPDQLVDLVYFVYLVHLVSFVQPNKRDKPNKPNEQDWLADFFSILLVLPGGIVTGVAAHSS
jgi:hypothetical protein